MLKFICHSINEISCGILVSCQVLSNLTAGGFFVQRKLLTEPQDSRGVFGKQKSDVDRRRTKESIKLPKIDRFI